MQTEVLQGNSSNITRPLNQSVQQSNGAQFALMLSLLYESQSEQTRALQPPVMPLSMTVPASTVGGPQSVTEFNLETSQTRSLQNNQQSHFQLLHSLYAERSVPVDTALQNLATSHAADAEGVLRAIEQGRGNATAAHETEKISFASPAQAA